MIPAALRRQLAGARPEQLRDWLIGVLALGAPLLAALVLAFHSGGFFITSWGIAFIVLLAVVAMVVVFGGGVGGRLGLISIVGWAGLAAWQGVSMLWADDPSRARNAMLLTLLFVAALLLAMVGLRRRAWLERASEAALAVSAIVVGSGVAARLFPGFGEDPTARLSWPVGYWNALGALAAFGVILAIAVGSAPRRNPAIRGVALALLPVLTLGLLMTLSRGGVVVAGIGLVVLVALSSGRVETIVAGGLGLVFSAPVLLYANDQPGLVALQGELPAHGSAGATAAALAAAGMVAAGLTGAFVPMALSRLDDRSRRRVGLGLSGAGVLVVVVGAALLWPSEGPITAAERQFDSFREFSPGERGQSDSISDQLAVAAGSGRWQNWDVAVQEFESAPIAGTGAGDYVFWWNAERTIDISVVNAHSLFLETLGESGVLGLLLLLIPFGVGAFAVGRRLSSRPPPGHRRELGATSAAVIALFIHAGIDWDWQLPAVLLPAVVLLGATTKAALIDDPAEAAPREADRAPTSLIARSGVALASLLAIALAIGPTLAAHDLMSARELAREGDLRGGLEHAQTAHDLDPQSPEPLLLQANIHSDLGQPVRADQAYAAALARAPRDWVILTDWTVALESQGRIDDAALVLSRAFEVNPLEPRVQLLNERLPPNAR